MYDDADFVMDVNIYQFKDSNIVCNGWTIPWSETDRFAKDVILREANRIATVRNTLILDPDPYEEENHVLIFQGICLVEKEWELQEGDDLSPAGYWVKKDVYGWAFEELYPILEDRFKGVHVKNYTKRS